MANKVHSRLAGPSTAAAGECLIRVGHSWDTVFHLDLFSSRLARWLASKVLVAWWMVRCQAPLSAALVVQCGS